MVRVVKIAGPAKNTCGDPSVAVPVFRSSRRVGATDMVSTALGTVAGRGPRLATTTAVSLDSNPPVASITSPHCQSDLTFDSKSSVPPKMAASWYRNISPTSISMEALTLFPQLSIPPQAPPMGTSLRIQRLTPRSNSNLSRRRQPPRGVQAQAPSATPKPPLATPLSPRPASFDACDHTVS